MLYCYYGSDIDAARKKVQATVAKMLAQNPDAVYFRITADLLEQTDFEELTASQGLFKSEYIVVLDRVFEASGGEECVLDALELIAQAPHPFFLLEGALRAPARKKIEAQAKQVQVFESAAKKKEGVRFNPFDLSDALGEGNTKKLWTLFREAQYEGIPNEEIHGILLWMYKSMALATQASSPEEAGMKAFPFGKAQRYARRFSSPEELRSAVAEFALLPTDARRHGIPLEIALERHILTH